MSRLFDEDGHISVEVMSKLKEGNLSDDELIIVLEHITNCSECAEVLADSYDENELVEVPKGFEESIKYNIKNEKQAKFNFGLYCMKVTAAAAIAIIMVFSNQLNFLSSSDGDRIKIPDYKKADSVCLYLNSISEKIINLEVFK